MTEEEEERADDLDEEEATQAARSLQDGDGYDLCSYLRMACVNDSLQLQTFERCGRAVVQLLLESTPASSDHRVLPDDALKFARGMNLSGLLSFQLQQIADDRRLALDNMERVRELLNERASQALRVFGLHFARVGVRARFQYFTGQLLSLEQPPPL